MQHVPLSVGRKRHDGNLFGLRIWISWTISSINNAPRADTVNSDDLDLGILLAICAHGLHEELIISEVLGPST